MEDDNIPFILVIISVYVTLKIIGISPLRVALALFGKLCQFLDEVKELYDELGREIHIEPTSKEELYGTDSSETNNIDN